jgi:EAL domain-containing protein (putative c-di-GMP-specific phosphodiesterase class I)
MRTNTRLFDMSAPAGEISQSLLAVSSLLAPRTGPVDFMAGVRIFEQGEPSDCAYMIESGYVEVSSTVNSMKNVLATLGPGEIFGEMALIDGQLRSATATALHETRLISISREQLLEEVSKGSPVVRLVLISAINRVRKRQFDEMASSLFLTLDGGVQPEQAKADFEAARIAATHQVKLRFELERAIADQQFELAYQPIVALADGRTSGFEALLRWPRPGQAMVSPAEFIPLAESTGLIVPLGTWVLESALKALSAIESQGRRERSGGADLFVSVNVSPRQLDCEENIERLATTIEQADVNPAQIKLEITEQALLGDPRMAIMGLSRLRGTGASLAIDDFGTGYSSLNYLHRYPLDTLKIDRSFISGIDQDEGRQRVVAAIIGLSHELGMEVVAEGIEETAELRWLQSQTCDYGQGYLFAKPSPFAAAMISLKRDFEW